MFGQDSVALPPISWVVPFLLFLYLLVNASRSFLDRKEYDDIPLVRGSRWPLPRLVLNGLFALNSRSLLDEGYRQFRDKPFRLRQADKDVIVLPISYLDELCTLPSSVASASAALDPDLQGTYTHSNLILETRLHQSIVQRKLTPRLGAITPRLQNQISAWFDEAFLPAAKGDGDDGAGDDWVEMAPYEVLGKLSSRLSAQAIVGPEFANNEVWLQSAWNYTESLFKTCTLLRLLPPWARPIFCHLLPSYREGKRCIDSAKAVLVPRIRELLRANDAGKWAPRDDDDDDSNVMRWLVDLVKGKDRNADTIAHIQVILSFASVHTILLRVLNVVYDLAAHPELVAVLEDEIWSVVVSAAAGGNGQDEGVLGGGDKKSRTGHVPYEKLYKLDSVMRESQRLSPPTMVGVKRLLLAPHQFRGQGQLRLPRGAYVCLPAVAIETDPSVYPDPLRFDGLRHYYLGGGDDDVREVGDNADSAAAAAEEEARKRRRKRVQFTTTGPDFLSFGHGKHACPGRYFAGHAIKMVLVKLLTCYEFSFLPGQGRPQHLVFHEFGLTDPAQKILVRRRKDAVCPF